MQSVGYKIRQDAHQLETKWFKQHSRGWWDLKHVLKWRGLIYNGDTEESKGVSLQQKKLEAEVAFKEAQSELTRLKTDIANGKIHR
ncbi:hypothetical protein KHA80_14275 [Anaerobacillus sp. HL2]|nr:hypothetical protein KHA80_14275 [Anaerobacillus sp. HL2]